MSDFVCSGCGQTITHGECVVELRNGYYSDSRFEVPWDETNATAFLHAGAGDSPSQPDCLNAANVRKLITAGGLYISGLND